jgi:dUTP pyrophosphatase
MKLKIKRIDKSLPLPEYQTAGAVAFDLYSRTDFTVPPKSIELVPTNIIVEIPSGYLLMVKDRSSTMRKRGLLIPVGFIDMDYSGPEDEIFLQTYNYTDSPVTLKKGERFGQAALIKIGLAEWEETDNLNAKTRGGFGSTD